MVLVEFFKGVFSLHFFSIHRFHNFLLCFGFLTFVIGLCFLTWSLHFPGAFWIVRLKCSLCRRNCGQLTYPFFDFQCFLFFILLCFKSSISKDASLMSESRDRFRAIRATHRRSPRLAEREPSPRSLDADLSDEDEELLDYEPEKPGFLTEDSSPSSDHFG